MKECFLFVVIFSFLHVTEVLTYIKYKKLIAKTPDCHTQCKTKMQLWKSRFKYSRRGKLHVTEHPWSFSKLTLLLAVSLFIFEKNWLGKISWWKGVEQKSRNSEHTNISQQYKMEKYNVKLKGWKYYDHNYW